MPYIRQVVRFSDATLSPGVACETTLLIVIPIVSALVLVQWSGQIVFVTQRGLYLQGKTREVYPGDLEPETVA